MAFSFHVTVWSSCQREGIGANRYMAGSFWGATCKISAILCGVPWVGGMFWTLIRFTGSKLALDSIGLWCIWHDYDLIFFVLQRAGAEFPKRSEKPAPLFNGQSQAARNMRSPDQQDEAESSAANDFPALRYVLLLFIFCIGMFFLFILFTERASQLICFIILPYYTIMVPKCIIDLDNCFL